MEQANNIQQINQETDTLIHKRLTEKPTVSNVPSISSSAMLVQLNVSTWTARKKDKEVSKKVARDNGASDRAGNYNKNLLAGCTELDDLKKFVGNARNTHYAMTLPWSDMGLRLIPTSSYFDYQTEMTRLEQEFWKLYDAFEDAYQWRIANAIQQAQELGAMFNHDDYPSVESLSRKFGWTLSTQPLPDAGDFRLDIPNEQQEIIKQQYEDFYSSSISSAVNDLWNRLRTNLETITRQLAPKDEVDAKGNQKYNKLYESVFDTSLDLIAMLRDFNLTGDTQMTAIANQLEDALYGVSPDMLKNNETARLNKQREVQTILDNLPSLDL